VPITILVDVAQLDRGTRQLDQRGILLSRARCSWRNPAQQFPSFQHAQRLVQASGDYRMAAGGSEVVDELKLRLSWPTAIGLKLKSEGFALVHCNEVRDAGADAKSLQDGCFDPVALAAVCDMPPDEARTAARPQVLANSALDRIFWAAKGALIDRTLGELAGLRHTLSPYFASAGASAFRVGRPR